MTELREKRDYYHDRSLKSVYFVDGQGRKQGNSTTYKENSSQVLYQEVYKDDVLQKRKNEKERLIEIFGNEARNLIDEPFLEGYTVKYYDKENHLYEQQSFEKGENGDIISHIQKFDGKEKLIEDAWYIGDTAVDKILLEDGKEFNGFRTFRNLDGTPVKGNYSVDEGYLIGQVDLSLKELWDKGYKNFSDKEIQTPERSIELSDNWHIKGRFRKEEDGIKFSGELGDVWFTDCYYIHSEGTYIRFNYEGDITKITQSVETKGNEHTFVETRYEGKTTRKAEVEGVYRSRFGRVSDYGAKIETLTHHEDGHIEHLIEEGTDAYNTHLDDGVPYDCARRKITRYMTLNGEKDGICEEFSSLSSNESDEQEYLAVRANYKEGFLHGLYQKFNEKGWVEIEANYKQGKLHGEYKELNSDGTIASIKNYENGVYKEKSEDGKIETWYNERNNVIFHATDGKEDTRLYLAKRKVAAKQVARSEEMREKGVETKNADGTTRKRTVVKKLGSIAKAWQMYKAFKDVDAGK